MVVEIRGRENGRFRHCLWIDAVLIVASLKRSVSEFQARRYVFGMLTVVSLRWSAILFREQIIVMDWRLADWIGMMEVLGLTSRICLLTNAD